VKVEDVSYILKAVEKWGVERKRGKGEQWNGLNEPK
jgi:hypothetical protein